jgi:hypothetical protein
MNPYFSRHRPKLTGMFEYRKHFTQDDIQMKKIRASTVIHILFIVSASVGANAFASRPLATKIVTAHRSTVDHINTEGTIETDYMPDSLLPPLYNRDAVASHRLSRMDIQRAMVDVKKFVESRLESDLNLIKVKCSYFTYGSFQPFHACSVPTDCGSALPPFPACNTNCIPSWNWN